MCACVCLHTRINDSVQVTDLLDPSKTGLAVRENQRDGIFVDGLTWENVNSVADTSALLRRGVRNRSPPTPHPSSGKRNLPPPSSHSLRKVHPPARPPTIAIKSVVA